ncbi:hypothetical protein F5Y17DRAFT_231845 [Xylariaceae sp. FL0594]|nr:hypothetical protein F5Y17DRAFT_231845 [Xylariaceae sp. FL0594]
MVLFFAWLSLLLLAISFLVFYTHPIVDACGSDGSFSPYYRNDYWDPSGIFQINLGFGSFSFTEVKVIDTAWDVVVGRLGQGILALISWRVFADYATVSMRATPITYTAYIVLFLDSGPTITSFYRLTRDLIRYRYLKSKLAAACVISSMVFILAWPTLVAAMTGYTPLTEAYVKDVEGHLITYREFHPVDCVIRDSDRIGLTDNFIVISSITVHEVLYRGPSAPLDLSFASSYTSSCTEDGRRTLPATEGMVGECWESALRSYYDMYGFRPNNTASKWQNQTLQSPSLDIVPYGVTLWDPSLGSERRFAPAWTYQNHLYLEEYILTKGTCNPSDNSFQWGFSYVQLFVLLILLLTWSTYTYILCHKAQRFLPLEDEPERPRGLRALLLLAAVVKEELEVNHVDPHAMTNQQLKRYIYKKLKGGSASFSFTLHGRKADRRPSILRRVAQCLWLLLFVGATIVSPIYSPAYSVFFVLLPGAAYFLGTTTKSRLVFMPFVCILFLILQLPLLLFVFSSLDDIMAYNLANINSFKVGHYKYM